MKVPQLQSLLETILCRKAVIKELEKETKVMEAKLDSEMAKTGHDRITSASGGLAYYMPNTTVKAADMATLLRTFDARTLAAILSESTVNRAKQSFLERSFTVKQLASALVTTRTSSFRIDLPRSKEQQAYLTEAIANDVREQEAKITAMIEEWEGLQDPKLPHKEPKQKKVTKATAPKKGGKK